MAINVIESCGCWCCYSMLCWRIIYSCI